MTKQQTKNKLSLIIKTYLLAKGNATAHEIADFINFNYFALGQYTVTPRMISNLIRGDYYGVLRDCKPVKETPTKVKIYGVVKK